MPLPFSDVPAFRRDPLTLLMQRAHSAEPGFVPLNLGRKPIWFATDPSIARQLLKWSPSQVDKGQLVQTLVPLVGHSLLTNIGSDHRQTKTAIHRHVRMNAITQNLDKLVAIINRFVARLAIDREFDTRLDLPPLALQLASVAIFGRDVLTAADGAVLVEAVQIVEAEIADDMFRLPLMPRWPGGDKRRCERIDYARKVVSLVVKRVRTKESRSEIIKGLEQSGLSDQQIDDEILGLLIAGHHTTAASFGWMLYYLATDPELAEMIALEADAVLPAIEDNDQKALGSASLSQTFVKEILRLYPAGWWTSREAFAPVTIGGQKFQAGDMFMVSPWQLHRDDRFWVEPDTLDLGRSFTEEAYVPFGIGPRACIGMSIGMIELQLLVLQLATAFSLELAPGTATNIKPHPSVTLLFPQTKMVAIPRMDATYRQQVA